jgi:SH3-like domain-containing protein
MKLVSLGLALALGLTAQPAIAEKTSDRGAVTNLPIPRFVSLKATKANIRRGPSLSHRVDWVFQRKNMPLKVVAEYGHWRRVQDADGASGWVHYSLISGTRMVLVQGGDLALREKPNQHSATRAIAEEGVVARLRECEPMWCRIEAEGHRGWAEKTMIWGVEPEELRD